MTGVVKGVLLLAGLLLSAVLVSRARREEVWDVWGKDGPAPPAPGPEPVRRPAGLDPRVNVRPPPPGAPN